MRRGKYLEEPLATLPERRKLIAMGMERVSQAWRTGSR